VVDVLGERRDGSRSAGTGALRRRSGVLTKRGVRNEAVRDGDQVRKIVITRGCTEVCKADAVLEEVRGGALDVGTKSPLGLGAVSLVHHQFVRKA
jgi:hypothetical protein